MPKREVCIVNRLGLHARAAAKFVGTASRFEAEIYASRDDREVNGKSIMGVMMLAAARGSSVYLRAEPAGEVDDAEQALDALEALIADRFGEAE